MVSVSNNHPFRRTELLIDKGCGGDDWGVSTPFREAVILVVVGASGDDGKLDIHMVGMSGLGLGRCMWWRGISLFSPSAIFDMGKLQMAELPPLYTRGKAVIWSRSSVSSDDGKVIT